MEDKLRQLKQEALEAIRKIKDKIQLGDLENKFLGRKSGELTNLLKGLKNLSDADKKTAGPLANEVKTAIEEAVAVKREELAAGEWQKSLESEGLDITQPALPPRERGHFSPIALVQRDLEEFFTSMGFMVLDGPELESDYYNFTALNIPETHPARDSQDTFYIKNHPQWLMRTHTSPMQVRAMQKYGAPLRAIAPGRCFRNEATDARHEHTLDQLEGIIIDKEINFSHLKGVLQAVARHLYGPETRVRLRPKFYPFVEPGVNGEVTCFLCHGQGCRLCKQSGWLEIFGAGLIHPEVLREGGVDQQKGYQGLAFGLGLSRLAMLKYGIGEIRLFLNGDPRFSEQF